MKKPQRNLRESFNTLEDIPFGRTSEELISVTSNEWLVESELSSKVIHLDSSSILICCIINTDQIDGLYNPVVGDKYHVYVSCRIFITRHDINPNNEIHEKSLRIYYP